MTQGGHHLLKINTKCPLCTTNEHLLFISNKNRLHLVPLSDATSISCTSLWCICSILVALKFDQVSVATKNYARVCNIFSMPCSTVFLMPLNVFDVVQHFSSHATYFVCTVFYALFSKSSTNFQIVRNFYVAANFHVVQHLFAVEQCLCCAKFINAVQHLSWYILQIAQHFSTHVTLLM